MKAIVLAAGRGSRMGKMTGERPKCLTPLAGRTLLEWQLGALRAAGVTSVTVIRGYCREQLAGGDYDVLDNPRWSETNMVATLACADALLRDGPCLISYSDIVYHPDAVRQLARAVGDLALTYDLAWEALWRARFDDPLSDAETFRLRDGAIAAIGDRASSVAEVEGQYMGLLKFEPPGWQVFRAAWSQLPAGRRDRIDMTNMIRMLVAGGVRITAVPVEGRWCEVDSARDLNMAADRLASGERWSHDWRW